MFMSCYLILRVLLYSAAAAARFISFHLLFSFVFLSLFSYFFVRFAFLFLFVWKYFTFTDILHAADKLSGELPQSPSVARLLLPYLIPLIYPVLAPTRRFMTFTFMTGICVCVCAPFAVCKREKQLKY